jgi:hypothetical protein
MNYVGVAIELRRNRGVFLNLLTGLRPEEYVWKSKPEEWNILEILCHLYDEEREDFRKRLHHTLEFPESEMESINPPAWVIEKDYANQDFNRMLAAFLNERDLSLSWLETLKSPKWQNVHQHPKMGPVTAKMFFVNWLAHDYLHIRQILRMKHMYLKEISGESLDYAGTW